MSAFTVQSRHTHQVEVEVDAGPRDAGHAVEPEAGEGRDVAPRYDGEAVDVPLVLVHHTQEELYSTLKLQGRMC